MPAITVLDHHANAWAALARARLWVRNRTELRVTLEQQSRPIAETKDGCGIVRVKRYGFDMR
jgi:hypothetical protein